MKKGLKAVTAIMGVVLVSGALAACKYHDSHRDHGRMMKEHIDSTLHKIGATEEQRAKIGEVTDQIVTDGKQLCKNDSGLKASFVGSLMQEKPDSKLLHNVVDEKAKDLTAFAHRTVDRLIEISSILTPKQKTDLYERYQSAHGSKNLE